MIRCPNCETENACETRFCDECGFPLSGSIARGAGAASPARKIPSYDTYHAGIDPHFSSVAHKTSLEENTHLLNFDQPAQTVENNLSTAVSQFSRSNYDSLPAQTLNSKATSIKLSSTPEQVYDALGQGRTLINSQVAEKHDQAPIEPLLSESDDSSNFYNSSELIDEQFYRDESFNSFNSFNNFTSINSKSFDSFEKLDNFNNFEDCDDFDAFASKDTMESYDEFESLDTLLDNVQETQIINPVNTVTPASAATNDRRPSVRDYNSRAQSYFSRKNTTKFSSQSVESQNSSPETNTRLKLPLKKTSSQTQGNEKEPSTQKKLSTKQFGLIVSGIAVVFISLLIVGGFALGWWGGIAVPNVVGLDQEQAISILEEDGFTVKTMQVKSDEIEGRVLVMDPGAGSFADEGSEIIIHVATARTVPSILGENIDNAKQMLSDAGYTNISYETYYTDDEENIVISVDPEPESRAKSNVLITVTVSENYRVPDISKLTLDQAQSAIEEAGLVPSVSYFDTDQYEDGTVIGTNPSQGTKVSEGSTVSIQVARRRGVELNNLAQEILASGNNVEIGGVSYAVESLDSTEYLGDDVVAFTVTAKPFVSLFGEILYASSSQSISGQISFSSDNEVIDIG